MRYLAIAVVAVTLTNGCAIVTGKKSADSVDLSSACAQAAKQLARHRTVAAGTSPPSRATLLHEFQRSCPARARATGLAWTDDPKCLSAAETRIACTGYADRRVSRVSASRLTELISH